MTAEARFDWISWGASRTLRLEAEGAEDVDASDVRPRTHEGILVIRRNLDVLEDSSRPAG